MSTSECTGHISVITLDPDGYDHDGQARKLLEAGPVIHVLLPAAPGGEPVHAWAVTRHAVLKDLLVSKEVTKDYRQWDALMERDPAQIPWWGMVGVDNVFTADGERHRRLRAPFTVRFSPRAVADLANRIGDLTARLLADLADTAQGGVVDAAVFAEQLPLQVIARIAGVDDRHLARLGRLVAGTFAPSSPHEAASVYQESQEFMAELVNERRGRPADDMISDLLDAEAAGELEAADVPWTLWITLTAGHETTRGLITNALRALLTHPEQLALIRGGEATYEDAVHETLRRHGSVAQLLVRVPTVPELNLAGVPIAKGEGILACFHAANLDSRAFEDPDRFDITRPHTSHMAFGSGAHVCPGGHLARLEIATALRAFFGRFPHATLTGDPLTPVRSLFTNSVQSLPVHLT